VFRRDGAHCLKRGLAIFDQRPSQTARFRGGKRAAAGNFKPEPCTWFNR
jgi:hypothetical protein